MPFSPAELAYLYASLALDLPVRPDGRRPGQFRSIAADPPSSDVIGTSNGSARLVASADGTEAIGAVRLELQRTGGIAGRSDVVGEKSDGIPVVGDGEAGDSTRLRTWIDVSVDVPGQREDDGGPVLLAGLVTDALVGTGSTLLDRLRINDRFHWRLCIDVVVLQPASAPGSGSTGPSGGGGAGAGSSSAAAAAGSAISLLPLVSTTVHLALCASKVPALVSEKEDDPLFSDDWAIAPPLFPTSVPAPPITLVVATVGSNLFFDPAASELAVADSVLALSLQMRSGKSSKPTVHSSPDVGPVQVQPVRLLAVRTLDPPSRATPAGVPDSLLDAGAGTVGSGAGAASTEAVAARELLDRGTVWRPPRGGIGRSMISRVVNECVRSGGVGEDVFVGLSAHQR